jgi:hypothetical protein
MGGGLPYRRALCRFARLIGYDGGMQFRPRMVVWLYKFIRVYEMPTLAKARREAIDRLKIEFPWFEQPTIPSSIAGSNIRVAAIVDPINRLAVIESDIATLRSIAYLIEAAGERQIADASRTELDKVQKELKAK